MTNLGVTPKQSKALTRAKQSLKEANAEKHNAPPDMKPMGRYAWRKP
jgi:hypothetical protein